LQKITVKPSSVMKTLLPKEQTWDRSK